MPSEVKTGVVKFFENQLDFNIRRASIANALQKPDALQGVALEDHPQVAASLKTLQRVQSLTADPEHVPALVKGGTQSAHQVAQMPKSQFVRRFEKTVGPDAATQIHSHATTTVARNEQALLQIHQAIKGAGIAAIDGSSNLETRIALFKQLATKSKVNINLEALFGSLDYCECDDCTTVYSPANYYVDLIQYLRNNNLDPKTNPDGTLVHPVSTTLDGTVLEVLLKRRPDLQYLLLTCENTNTLILYIDLANEVMESFVVHLDDYPKTWTSDAQSDIDVFNVLDETSNELLAEPQHTNYNAYCILRQAVSPLSSLPFHQPIEAIRIYLRYLKTSRTELLDIFRKPFSPPAATPPFDSTSVSELAVIHDTIINRAVTAEFLNIIQEEYIILTKEAFWPKEYFDLTRRSAQPLSITEYQQHIGVRRPREYWGYDTDAHLRSDDKLAKIGLRFVKAQFLKRSGMDYPDVVDLVKTRFINPFYPKGKDLLIMQSIRFSYRFLQYLQSLVNKNAKHKKEKFAFLVAFLVTLQPWLDAYFKGQLDDVKLNLCNQISPEDICSFVYRWFDCLGNLVVLENGENPTLPVYGRFKLYNPVVQVPVVPKVVPKILPAEGTTIKAVTHSSTNSDYTTKGTLFDDGTITDSITADPTGNVIGNIIGFVGIDSKVYNPDGTSLADGFKGQGELTVVLDTVIDHTPVALQVGVISEDGYLRQPEARQPVKWNPVVDDCNIDSVRLQHLDGTMLSLDDWDRMQQFIRLWKRLGCTIDELDHAIVGWSMEAAAATSATSNTTTPPPDLLVNIDDIAGSGDCESGGTPNGCDHKDGSCTCLDDTIPDCVCAGATPVELNPDFLDQYVNVKKIQDLTSIELIQLLAFWDNISTAGDKSLYSTLFLTHNLIGVDSVFKPDANDNVLVVSTKIKDHIPVIMAALRIKQDELQKILVHTGLMDSDLTLDTISLVYRYSLLANSLNIKPSLLIAAIGVFGEPFPSAKMTLAFVTRYNKFIDAGFTVPQLVYVAEGIDNPIKPLGPKTATILKTTKTILDGLSSIQTSNPDLTTSAVNTMTVDLVTQKTSLLFQKSSIDAINAFLQGSSIYTMAVATGLKITVPPGLTAKISYVDTSVTTGSSQLASLVVTGILTGAEVTLAKSLSADPSWAPAIQRAAKKALAFFNANLASIFEDQNEAIAILLAGDVAPHPIPPAPATTVPTPGTGTTITTTATTDPPPMDPGTAPGKEFYFLQNFLPYLRDQLSNQLIITTMASESGISSNEITTALLTSILKIDGGSGSKSQTPMEVLRGLQGSSSGTSTSWTGYLIPPTTDIYTIVGFGLTQPAPIILDGEPWTFDIEQEDPEGAWWTAPKPLTGGRLYMLNSGGQSVPGLQWKTAYSQASLIPSSALLPNLASDSATKVFTKLAKAAILVNGLSLTIDEVNYFQSRQSDFSAFDLDNVTVPSWERILDYEALKNSLPASSTSLLDVFKWGTTRPSTPPPSATEIAAQISLLTSNIWPAADVATMIGPRCLGLGDVKFFVNEIALTKIQTAFTAALKIGVEIPTLFKWADPLTKFWPTHAIAEDIRNRIRSRYTLDDWEKIAAPLHNELRMKQRDALVAYLIVQKQLIEWGVVDADSLFEFFLIDVQMGACLKTSRIKQAISTIQTFVQRCFLGLETGTSDAVISPDTLDRDRWKWMQKQTLWAANMKVLVNPESYLIESLRDDKSPLYLDLENELKQKDVNTQTLQDSIKKYISEMDKVSNLLAEGLFVDDTDDNKLYIIARTRSSPYFRFYRTYSPATSAREWTPWQTLPVDIQTYHVDPAFAAGKQKNGQCDGNYVIPVVLQGRFIVFFAQITPYSQAPDGLSAQVLGTGTPSVGSIQRLQSWKIQLGWSELRNGKWLQKQLTTEFLMETPTSPTPPPMEQYLFLPTISSDPDTGEFIQIAVMNQSKTCVGGFQYQGSQAFVISKDTIVAGKLFTLDSNAVLKWDPSTQFHMTVDQPKTDSKAAVPPTIYSLQVLKTLFDPPSRSFVQYPLNSKSMSTISLTNDSKPVPFYHQFSHQLLSSVNGFPNLDYLFATYGKQLPAVQSTAFGEGDVTTADDGTQYYQYDELSTTYSLYNWEVGFHAPMELAESLFQSQQFDSALDICHYVFDPYAAGDTAKRVWKWIPFTKADPENVIITLFNKLAPNTPDDTSEVTAWRKNPYAPHVVARKRPVAYMKYTAMLYLKILIAYGDYYFRQNSLEAVPLALQCYILASHIYGPKAQMIPPRGKKQPQSYSSLLNKWDAISNAVVDLELEFPFSNQMSQPWGFIGQEPVLANLFGFATTHYFDIPANPQLQALRSLIDDRLYKIRHCQDINGNSISLALWDPPIDPSILVAAVAQGLSLSDILNDMNAPMPNYRFFFLLQKALDLCNELKSLASSFLSIKEKQDTEALQLLRATQDNAIQILIMEVRNTSLTEAGASLDALRTTRRGPMARYKHYTSLAGIPPATITETDTDYIEVAPAIPAPLVGELALTQDEQNDMDEARSAKDDNSSAGDKEVFAGGCFAFPRIGEKGEPWGIGASIHFGPSNIGQAATAHARYLRSSAEEHNFNSSNSGKKATYIKQFQDRALAADTAGLELLQISKQIVSQQLRVQMAAQEITNQQKVIDSTDELLEFLKNKYTNDQLYSWMEGNIKTLLYETYKLAYDVAKKAESAYLFEQGPQASSFIQFGYWDVGHDGLYCGERLYVSLKQLESAYQEKRGYDFEIMKAISLRQINPGALLDLRETGTCQFDVPEILFDMDFPGHYFRRIKSVAVTVPCVVGPYASINCTLRLLSHRYRLDPSATDKNSYVEKTDGDGDPRFSTVNIPIDSIAVSSGQNDGGVFEFGLNTERYLPFEGAGSISKWQLDLPSSFRQFDYNSITDVILSMRYTSRNGGDKLKKPASDTVDSFISSIQDLSAGGGLFTFIDIKSEYASEWARAASPIPTTTPPTPNTPRTITLKNLSDRLPIFTRGTDATKIKAKSVTLLTATALQASNFSIITDPTGNTDPITFGNPDTVGKLNKFSNEDVDNAIGTWALQITGDGKMGLERIYLIVSYVLGK
jgi:hypothetical protein